MVSDVNAINPLPERRRGDFWKFWGGQVISSFGSSFTSFALPLLVFKLTGSALNLGLAFTANMLPNLFFGLLIGALVDRVDRRRLMIAADLLRALVIGVLPLIARLGFLSVWWIYVVLFINATLAIGFDASSFAAIPSLVRQNDLVTANGRIQASYSLAEILGPLLAAALLTFMPLYTLLWCDAASFLVSAGSLMLIKTSFNTAARNAATNIRQDIVEGLRYTLTHPLVRWLVLTSFFANLIVPAIYIQFISFAKGVLLVSDAQLGTFYAAGSAAIVLVSLVAGSLSKRLPFSVVGLGALMLQGLLTIWLSFTRAYWAALPIWAFGMSMATFYNINVGSLGQKIIPNNLLGRLITLVKVLTWSTSPLGALLAGFLIEQTKNTSLVYAALGVLAFLVPFVFLFTPLGRVEKFIE